MNCRGLKKLEVGGMRLRVQAGHALPVNGRRGLAAGAPRLAPQGGQHQKLNLEPANPPDGPCPEPPMSVEVQSRGRALAALPPAWLCPKAACGAMPGRPRRGPAETQAGTLLTALHLRHSREPGSPGLFQTHHASHSHRNAGLQTVI